MDKIKEYLSNADIAYENNQYNEALVWYQKVLAEDPNNLYALSRAGAICVPLGKTEDAFKYFQKARDLDPANGDNAFNYGNACFFNRDNVGAFTAYVEAEKLGVSENVLPRLYYQMGMLCSLRQDIPSALLYFRKCEDVDRNGIISLNPDLISEKLKLYMISQDVAKATETAAQLVAIQPGVFRNYMVFFSLLMAGRDFGRAEKVLLDCQTYAQMEDREKRALPLQFSALYTAMADEDAEHKDELLQKAVDNAEQVLAAGGLTPEERIQYLQTVSEIYLKAGRYDDCQACLDTILNGGIRPKPAAPAVPAAEELPEPTEEELDDMLQADMENIQEQIDNGELDPDLGLYADTDYDEDGNPIHIYDPEPAVPEEPEEEPAPAEPEAPIELTEEQREKAVFTYLTCCLAKDDFRAAKPYADQLRSSSNKYYNYYGIYAATMVRMKIHGSTEGVRRRYAETIAFFRNKTFSDPKDSLAAILRGRLYAEEGKFAKAREIATLLAEGDQKSLLSYVDECEKQ